MKRYALPLIVAASLSSLSAQEAPAPAPTAPDAQAAAPAAPTAELSPEVRAYVTDLTIAAFKGMADLADQNKMQDPVAMIEMFLTIQQGVPSDKLPAEFQEYIKATEPLLQDALAKVKGAKPEEIEGIMMEMGTKAEAIKAKYPEAAKMLEPQAAQQFVMKDLKLEERVQELMMKEMQGAGEGTDPMKVLSKVFRQLAQEIEALKTK